MESRRDLGHMTHFRTGVQFLGRYGFQDSGDAGNDLRRLRTTLEASNSNANWNESDAKCI